MGTVLRKIRSDSRRGKSIAARNGLRIVARGVIALLASSIFLIEPPHVFAESQDAEYRVKLAFLYNFAQFIQWPAEAFHDPSAPLTMCVVGQDPFGGEIEETLHGRTVGGHPMQIKRLMPDDDLKACHMIFVRAAEKKVAARILAELKGSSTLTVGESKGFADLGGVINLTIERNKLRFEINIDAATQTRLKISSKLLELAKIVKVGANP